MKIEEFIKCMTDQLPVKTYNENFYYTVKKMLDNYYNRLKLIDESEFNDFLKMNNDDFLGNPTKARFLSLIKLINEKCLVVLFYLYQGDIYRANITFLNLLLCSKETSNKLNDMYVNYLASKFDIPEKLYRCVLFKNDGQPKICRHLPFELRHNANRGRYNMLGSIFLYLSDDKETAIKELGQINENQGIWISEYHAKKELILADLRIPTKEAICGMSEYDKFCFLISYPILLLCNFETNKQTTCSFNEEYLFPQLLSHILFIINDDEIPYYNKKKSVPQIDGLCYSSMCNKTTSNYLLPVPFHKGIIDDNGDDIEYKEMKFDGQNCARNWTPKKNKLFPIKGFSKYIEKELFEITKSYKVEKTSHETNDIQQKK